MDEIECECCGVQDVDFQRWPGCGHLLCEECMDWSYGDYCPACDMAEDYQIE